VVVGPATVAEVANLQADVFTDQRTALMHVLVFDFALFRLAYFLRPLLLKCKISLHLALEVSLHVKPPLPVLFASFFLVAVVVLK
jgi:hypothetical protein